MAFRRGPIALAVLVVATVVVLSVYQVGGVAHFTDNEDRATVRIEDEEATSWRSSIARSPTVPRNATRA
ncbi:hypothetical protein [Halalkalicoccus salilacus]|uniref:hypothetical protein n=1 Tax=Halalkalicoccus sp. GCM10025704 TaxID=3252662 RepID=UPI0036187813